MYDFVASYWPLLLLVLLLVLAAALRKRGSFFYWSARIVALLDILYLAWESLEVNGYTWEAFFDNNMLTTIPLAVILLIAWKFDLVGAIGFFMAGIFFLIYFEWGDFPIGIVPLVVGVFFAASWAQHRKRTNTPNG